MVSVLHVFGQMNRGGAEMRTVDLLRRVDPARFRLDFCALTGRRGDLDGEIERLGGQVHLVRLGAGFPLAFARLLLRQRYQVVHSHVHLSSGAILALARLCGVPGRVAHFRSTSDGRRSTAARRLQRRLLRRALDWSATDILAVGEGAMRETWGEGWTADPRCAVVYGGLAAEPFLAEADRAGVRAALGLPAGAALVLHVGRASPAKNQERVLAVFAGLAAARPEARLALVGRSDGPSLAVLRAEAARLGLEGRVVFTGLRDDVPRLMKAADLLLFPSRWEGLPGTVLEACAAGLPVLASDLPGVRELQRSFPGIAVRRLEQPDQAWVEAGLGLLAAGRPAAPPLADTPFDLEASTARLQAVWRRAAGEEGRG